MEDFILWMFILLLVALNILAIWLFKKGKVQLALSGVLFVVLAPVVGFSSGTLLHRFYDWSDGATGEGAGLGGAFLGLLTLANGLVLLVIGAMIWLINFRKKDNSPTPPSK